MTEESVVKLIEDLRTGRPVKIGPQSKQVDCEGPAGQTTLKDTAAASRPPQFRDIDALKAEVAAAQAAAAAAAAAAKKP